MELIKQNPFRVLGLFGNSSERELQKQISVIKRYAEIGKTKEFDYDFNIFGPVNRDIEEVKMAASKVEQAKNKLHYSLFWFIKVNHIDETALAHLRENNVEKATQIWIKSVGEKQITSSNFSSFSNLSTLLLGKSINNGSIDKAKFNYALNYKGQLINSEYFNSFAKLTGGDGFSFNSNTINKHFVDDVLLLVTKYLDQPNGLNHSELFNAFSKFPSHIKKYLQSKFIESPQHKIENSVGNYKELRISEPSRANEWGANLYSETKNELLHLKKILGVDDLKFQMLANKISNEILQCGIVYFNKLTENPKNDPGEKSLLLLKMAKSVAVSQQIIDRIEENQKNIQDWVDNAEERKLYMQIGASIEYITQKLNVAAKTLENKGMYPQGYNDPYSDKPVSQQPHNNPVISSFALNEDYNINLFRLSRDIVKDCKPKLIQIKDAIGNDHEIYIRFSTDLAALALACLIEYVNNSTNSLSAFGPIVNDHQIKAMNAIGDLKMNPDMRKRYESQKRALTNLYNQVNRKYSSNTSNTGGGCYIATMVYGNYNHPKVMVLRKFRDETLANNLFGRAFIKFYYSTSPRIVSLLKDQQKVNRIIRKVLDQFTKNLNK
jgi:hypothetical protein